MTQEKTKPTYEQMRDDGFFEYHGCVTGDCPHDHYEQCYREMYKEGSDWALTLPLSVLAEKHEGVRGLVESFKKIKQARFDLLNGHILDGDFHNVIIDQLKDLKQLEESK